MGPSEEGSRIRWRGDGERTNERSQNRAQTHASLAAPDVGWQCCGAHEAIDGMRGVLVYCSPLFRIKLVELKSRPFKKKGVRAASCLCQTARPHRRAPAAPGVHRCERVHRACRTDERRATGRCRASGPGLFVPSFASRDALGGGRRGRGGGALRAAVVLLHGVRVQDVRRGDEQGQGRTQAGGVEERVSDLAVLCRLNRVGAPSGGCSCHPDHAFWWSHRAPQRRGASCNMARMRRSSKHGAMSPAAGGWRCRDVP